MSYSAKRLITVRFAIVLFLLFVGYMLIVKGSWMYADDFLHWKVFGHSDSYGEFAKRVLSGDAYLMGGDNHWRPLTNFQLGFLYRLTSTDLIHWLRLPFHFGCGILVGMILWRFEKTRRWAQTATVLCIVNPVVHNDLHYIAALGDITTTFFSLGVVYLVTGEHKRFSAPMLALIALLFAAALTSKEMCVTLPVLLTGYAILTNRFRVCIPVLLLLFIEIVLFFSIRTMIIDKVLMGSSYSTEFTYNLHSFVSLAKQLFLIIVPTPRWINFLYPILLLTALPALLPALLWGISVPFRRAIVGYSIAFAGIVCALVPVINMVGPWYRYYPAILWVIIIVIFASRIKSENHIQITRAAMIGMIVLWSGITIMWGENYRRVSAYERNFITQCASGSSDSLAVAGVPAYCFSDIPALSSPYFTKYAVLMTSGRNIHIAQPAMVVCGKLPDSLVQFDTLSGSHLQVIDRYSYFPNVQDPDFSVILEAPYVGGHFQSANISNLVHRDGWKIVMDPSLVRER